MENHNFRHDGLAGRVISPVGPTGLAVNLAGFPARHDPTPSVSYLLDAGLAVVQPQYFGTYDSDGVIFDGWGNAPVVDAAFQYGRTHLEVAGDGEVLVAHSYGTFVGVQALLRGLRVRRVALFAPMLAFSSDAGLRLDFDAHVANTRLLHPYTHRVDKGVELREFFASADLTSERRTDQVSGAPEFALFFGAADESLDPDRAAVFTRRAVQSLFPDSTISIESVVAHAGHGVDEMLADRSTADRFRSFISADE